MKAEWRADVLAERLAAAKVWSLVGQMVGTTAGRKAGWWADSAVARMVGLLDQLSVDVTAGGKVAQLAGIVVEM